MDYKEISFTIQSDVSNINLVLKWLEEDLFKKIDNKKMIDPLKLSIQEAVTNAIVHGNNNIQEKPVTISYKIIECKLYIKIEDEGTGIPRSLTNKNFEDQPEENLLNESGRGLMLVKHFCDDVKFHTNFIEFTMKICETPFDMLKKLSDDISILYVEDNDLARIKTTKILKRIFNNIDTAANGKSGLSMYMKKKYDLVLSDIVMPEFNGIEMIKAIKNVSKSQRVIFISAYTETKYLIDAIELRVDGFVFKPVENDKLYKALLKVIKQIIITRENISYKTDLEKLVDLRTKELKTTNEELVKMIEEVKKSNYLKEEMKIAQKVQENFLPKTIFNSQQLQTASFFKSATYVGGDYYDIFYCENGNINIIIADVSGHGIAPAITMSTFRGICRALLVTSANMQKKVEQINNMLCQDSKNNDFFITAVFIRYYKEKNKFEYISAGHNEMMHYNSEKNILEGIKSSAIPLGIFEHTKYPIIEKKVNKNDTLILYTDGLTEASNDQNEMFSFQRLYSIVDKFKTNSPNEILKNIKNSLSNFTKDEIMNDDTTILITKFL